MTTLPTSRLISRASAVASRDLPDRVLLATVQEQDRVITLRGPAAEVWRALSCTQTIEELEQAVEMAPSEEMSPAASAVVEELVALGLLTRS